MTSVPDRGLTLPRAGGICKLTSTAASGHRRVGSPAGIWRTRSRL